MIFISALNRNRIFDEISAHWKARDHPGERGLTTLSLLAIELDLVNLSVLAMVGYGLQ